MAFIAAAPLLSAAIGLGVVGAGVSAYGAIKQGQATAAADKYQAQVAANDAIIASQNAEYATQSGQAKATTTSLQNRAQLGKVVAAEAASGVDVNTGSAADAQTTQREMGTVDTQQVVNNAAITAYGYRTQAVNYQANSQLLAAEAPQAATAGDIAAAGGLLSSAGSLGMQWARLGNNTTTPAWASGASGASNSSGLG
jgi:hypothetical protein